MKRSQWILIGVLVVLAVATFFVLRQPGEVSTSDTSGRVLVSYDSAAVDKIEVRSPSGVIILEKEAGRWMLTSPVKYRADEAAIALAIGTGRRIQVTNVVSSNPEKRGLFQVDSNGTLVKIFENGAQKAAFVVGKMGTTYTETYVRVDGSNDVFLAEAMLGTMFYRQTKDWRDKTIFKMDEAAIKSVSFQYGDTTFTLAFQDSMWRIGKDTTVTANVKPFLTAIANLQADDFIDSALTMSKPPTAVLQVGGSQIRLYPKDGGNYLVQTSQSPQWFELQSWKATQILKRRKDFLPKVA